MAFTRKTELRHISPAELKKVAQLLSHASAWKKLMQAVPSVMKDPEQLGAGKTRYNLNDIKLIETACATHNKLPAEMFVEEWATSGRIRPTLSHLLQLLENLELFRAADYVAERLLSENPPLRPSKGPAARVLIPLLEEDVSDVVSNTRNPGSVELMNLNVATSDHKNFYHKRTFDLMKNVPISDVDLIRFSSQLTNLEQSRSNKLNNSSTEESENCDREIATSSEADFQSADNRNNSNLQHNNTTMNLTSNLSSLHDQPNQSSYDVSTKITDSEAQLHISILPDTRYQIPTFRTTFI